MEAICTGDIGFDVRRAHKHGISQSILDGFDAGGHCYGRGPNFAEAAIYSHCVRKHPQVNADGIAEYVLILAQVFTGHSKDFGSSWAPDLSVEPNGYHSVCGTESDQQLPNVVSPRACS